MTTAVFMNLFWRKTWKSRAKEKWVDHHLTFTSSHDTFVDHLTWSPPTHLCPWLHCHPASLLITIFCTSILKVFKSLIHLCTSCLNEQSENTTVAYKDESSDEENHDAYLERMKAEGEDRDSEDGTTHVIHVHLLYINVCCLWPLQKILTLWHPKVEATMI